MNQEKAERQFRQTLENAATKPTGDGVRAALAQALLHDVEVPQAVVDVIAGIKGEPTSDGNRFKA